MMPQFPVCSEILPDLHQLILAIDRRLPRLVDMQEPTIAKDASELRAKALAMIQHLERAQRDKDRRSAGQ